MTAISYGLLVMRSISRLC